MTAVAVLLPLLAGCTSEDQRTPNQIVADAVAALETAQSYTVDLTATGTPIHTVASVEVPAAASLAVRGAVSGAEVDLRLIGGAAFVRVLAAPGAGGPGAPLLARLPSDGPWLGPLTAGELGSLVATIGADVLVQRPADMFTCLLSRHGTLTLEGTETLDGVSVIVLSDAGNAAGSAPATYFVEADAPYYPVRIEQSGPRRPASAADSSSCGVLFRAPPRQPAQAATGVGEPATVAFTDFDRSAAVEAPSPTAGSSGLPSPG